MSICELRRRRRRRRRTKQKKEKKRKENGTLRRFTKCTLGLAALLRQSNYFGMMGGMCSVTRIGVMKYAHRKVVDKTVGNR